jgi:hypothetical protein
LPTLRRIWPLGGGRFEARFLAAKRDCKTHRFETARKGADFKKPTPPAQAHLQGRRKRKRIPGEVSHRADPTDSSSIARPAFLSAKLG